MAFGFFKKTQAADIIFYNGHIYTHDPDFPWAEAVACTDGKISAVGDFDAMDGMNGRDTELVDLDGKYLFPGFIDVHRSPVMRVFEGKYLDLSSCTSTEEICDMVAAWAGTHPDADVLFGYAFRDDLDPQPEQLDAVCSDRPVVLLAESGIGCSVNSAAEQFIQETAEEECVEVVTVPYVLNLMMPFDFEEIEASVAQTMDDLSEMGITTVLNQQSPDYFESLYQDSLVGLYSDGLLRQRFYGSYLMNRPLQPRGLLHTMMRRKTNCSEMSGMVHAKTLEVYLNERACPMDFPQEMLDEILLSVADKGFDILIKAIDREDLRKAYETAELLRNKGYRNVIVIASECQLTEEEQAHLEHRDDVIVTWLSHSWNQHPTALDCLSVEEAVDALTVEAAKIIGIADEMGRIEKGRLADFTVFRENPLEKDVHAFAGMHAVMTVVDGKIVYNAESELSL